MGEISSGGGTVPAPPSVDDIVSFISAAKTGYEHAKTGAMQSAAGAYLVYHFAASESATPKMRDWLHEEIAKANSKIDAHNKAINHRRERAKQFKKNTLNEEPSADEIARLTADAERSSSDWSALKHVKIEAREGASKFTSIVKYVFEFKKPSDASLASRYSKVLEYIELHKDELQGRFNINAVVALLTKAGGFEAAIEAVRGNTVEETDVIRASKLAKIMSAVDDAHNGEIVYQPRHEARGYVFMIGRASGGKTTVCGELRLDDEEADELMLKIDASVLGPNDPVADFAGRAFSIGELVREGHEGNVTIEATKSGAKHKVTRTYTITAPGGSARMVVSARYTDVSTVVHAVPKPHVNIGHVAEGQFAALAVENCASICKQFSDEVHRALLTVMPQSGADASLVVWSVDTDLENQRETQTLEWKSLFAETHRPVDMFGYSPDWTIKLTAGELRDVYEKFLFNWIKTKKNDQNVTKPIAVKYDGIHLTMGHTAYDIYTHKVASEKGAPAEVIMRPRDLVDLIRKIIDLDAGECTLSADSNGMLSASWEDDLGNYTVYLPAVEPRGSLNRGCTRYMKPTN
jgi:hypothetical protein